VPKFPKPWFRPNRGVWYATIGNKQHNLGADKEEAFRRYHELMGRKPQKPQSPDSVIGLLDRFLAWCKEHRKPETYEWYLWRLQKFTDHLKRAGLTTLSVSALKPFHLDEWLQPMTSWSSGTKHGMARAVQRVFMWAEKKGYLDRSPIAHYEKSRPGKRNTVIPLERFQQILEHVKSEEFRDLLQITWETGARPQETLVVEARHVDLAHARWVFPVDEAKGELWPRIVYLNETALAITQRLMEIYPTGPLFRNRDAKPWTTDAVNCGFIRLQIALGRAKIKDLGVNIPKLPRLRGGSRKDVIVKTHHATQVSSRRKTLQKLALQNGPKYCLYTLRHSWADKALKSGLDALTVAILMGHRDPSTLSRVYQHLSQSPDYLQAAAQRAGL
jgi:integrase